MAIKNNNKLKIVVASLIIIGSSDLAYVRYGQFKDNEMKIQSLLNKAAQYLPPGVSQSNEVNHHAWTTDGVYTLNYKDKKNNESLVVTYKIKHNLWSYVTGNMDIEAESKINGTLLKDVKFAGNFLTTTGTIFRDGAISLFSQGSEITYNKDGNEVKIRPFNINMDYNASLDQIKNQLFISEININIQNNETKITHVELKHNVNANNIMLSDFSMMINGVTNKQGKMSNLRLTTKSDVVNNKYNLTNTLSISEVEINAVKQIDELDIGYAIIGLDKQPIDNFVRLSQKYNKLSEIQKDNVGEDLTTNTMPSIAHMMSEQDKKALQDNQNALLQKGFAVNIQPFKVKGNFGFIDLEGHLVVSPVKDIKSISFIDQAKMTLTASAQGSFVPTVKMYLGNQDNTEPTKLKTKISVEKGVLVIDGKTVENSFLNSMKSPVTQNMDSNNKEEIVKP